MAKKQKRGPSEDRLVVDGDWEKAIQKAIRVKRPPEGWPESSKSGAPKKPKKKDP